MYSEWIDAIDAQKKTKAAEAPDHGEATLSDAESDAESDDLQEASEMIKRPAQGKKPKKAVRKKQTFSETESESEAVFSDESSE